MTLPITRVVVHRDGAIVERRGSLEVVDGEVVVSGLPLLLDESSVRAITHTDGAHVRGVHLDLSTGDGQRPPEDEVTRKRRRLEADKAQLQAEHTALSLQRDNLGELVPRGPEEDDPAARPGPEQLLRWTTLEDRLADWHAHLSERLRALDLELAELARQLQVARHEEEQQSTQRRWQRWVPRREATVRLDADAEQVELTLSYIVPGATWTPAYALHTDASFRKGRFVVRALVVQNTGENWADVHLALSTASVARVSALAELPSRRLGAAQPAPPSPWRELPTDLDALFPDGLQSKAPAPSPRPSNAPTSGAVRPDDDEDDFLADLLEEEKPAPRRPKKRKAREHTTGAMPPPMPAPQAMPAAAMPKASRGGGGLGAAISGLFDAPGNASMSMAPLADESPPEAPGVIELEVTQHALRYTSLRLQSWQAPRGQRGRLRRGVVGEDLPSAAQERLGRERSMHRTRASKVRNITLPPHHVLPGPVEGADFRFDALDRVSLPSDGRFHKVALFTEPVELEVRYRTVPRMDSRAFRLVRASLASATPLLPGPADVYVDGSLELTAAWRGTPGRGHLEMGLGVEDRIRVIRNTRHDEESAGMFGGSRRLLTEVEVEVASSLSREVRVEVCERVPVAGEDDVRVELRDCDPAPLEWAGTRDGPILRGGKVQTLTVPAGGKTRALLRYAITLGSREEIVGGDRRA